MTKANTVLDQLLELDLSECEVTVCLASSSKDEVLPRFERLLLSAKLTETFRSVAAYTIAHYKKERSDGNLVLRSYAVESKPDLHEVEYLDLPTYESIIEQIGPLSALADVEIFEADEKFISGLRFYVVAVQPPSGQPVYFFRLYTHKKMLGRSRIFAIVFRRGIYDRIIEPAFLFDYHIDCVSYSGMMFIFKKENFHEMFRFFEMIRRIAKETLDTLRATVPIQNFEDFARDCEGHLAKLVKLKNIAAKPYWGKITIENIKKVIEKNNLPVQITRTNAGEMLVYDPSDKWVLLKLLDDDYLWSLMTDQGYEATSKRELE
jgi:Kiwa KwaB-like protein